MVLYEIKYSGGLKLAGRDDTPKKTIMNSDQVIASMIGVGPTEAVLAAYDGEKYVFRNTNWMRNQHNYNTQII